MISFDTTTRVRVVIAAILTTIGAVLIAQFLVFLLIRVPGKDLAGALQTAPIIVVITAFPLCMFVWLQVYRNFRLTKELRRLVNRDRLTDVATRDYFFERMAEDPNSFGVSLMIDIDHFKEVNDNHGHLVGDQVISRVAQILRTSVRTEDIICRFGGEEFIVFLSQHDHAAGLHVAERMRKTIEDEVFLAENHRLRVTVSIGGSLKDRIAHINQSIREADEALYRAKAEGRNRTIFADIPPVTPPVDILSLPRRVV